jgi:hypothetical protein
VLGARCLPSRAVACLWCCHGDSEDSEGDEDDDHHEGAEAEDDKVGGEVAVEGPLPSSNAATRCSVATRWPARRRGGRRRIRAFACCA